MGRIRTVKPELPQSESILRNFRGHFVKKSITAEMRREIGRRHGCMPGGSVDAKCAYCDFIGKVHWIIQPTDRGYGWVTFSDLEMDHVKPEYKGGKTDVKNLVLACIPCNRSKSIKSLNAWRNS